MTRRQASSLSTTSIARFFQSTLLVTSLFLGSCQPDKSETTPESSPPTAPEVAQEIKSTLANFVPLLESSGTPGGFTKNRALRQQFLTDLETSVTKLELLRPLSPEDRSSLESITTDLAEPTTQQLLNFMTNKDHKDEINLFMITFMATIQKISPPAERVPHAEMDYYALSKELQ